MILGIDHVGVAVVGVEEAAKTFAALTGGSAGKIEPVPGHSVRVCFVPEAAAVRLELLAPERSDGAVGRFVERRGEGLHHVCYAVDNIRAELARLKAAGFPLVDETPRPGHGGEVAFLHPRGTHGVLVELLQRA